MASIHAPIPPNLKEVVLEAKRRGEEHGSGSRDNLGEKSIGPQPSSTITLVVMKNQTISNGQQGGEGNGEDSLSIASGCVNLPGDPAEDDPKENDSFHSPSPI